MEKAKILVVDDEPTFTRAIKLRLEGTGRFEVRTENQAEHCLEAARKFKPDLILLDIVMPEVPGSEVAYQIQSDEEVKDTRIAFLTGTIMRKDEAATKRTIGGFPFIAKPVSGDELVARVEELLAA